MLCFGEEMRSVAFNRHRLQQLNQIEVSFPGVLQGLKDTIRTRALLALCSAVLSMWLYRQAWCFYHRKTPGKDLVPAESDIVSI